MGDFAYPLDPLRDLELKAKQELTTAYHLASILELDDIIFTHFSRRVPKVDDCFYINPFGYLFEEIQPSDLVTVRMDGTIIAPDSSINPAGYIIHSAIYETRPDVEVVMHLHSPCSLAVASLDCGLLPLSQFSMMFYNRVSYHDFEGISLDPDEKKRFQDNLGSHSAMLLKNHGLLVTGSSIPDAFMRMYYLEQSCKLQLQIQSSSQNYCIPQEHICEKTAQQFETTEKSALELAWKALLRRHKLSSAI